MGEQTTASHLTIPAGWALLPLANQNHDLGMLSTDVSDGFYVSSFLAAYVYQANDPGQYTFKVQVQAGPEVQGFLVSYRGADPALADYTTYGYPVSTLTFASKTGSKALSPPGGTTLLNIFEQSCLFNASSEDPDYYVVFGSPTGNPTLTVETSLTPNFAFLAADVDVPVSGSYGPYSSYLDAGNACSFGGINFAHQVIVPEL